MANKRVRVGQHFYYVPVMLDAVRPPYNVEVGDYVTVVNLPGCPRLTPWDTATLTSP